MSSAKRIGLVVAIIVLAGAFVVYRNYARVQTPATEEPGSNGTVEVLPDGSRRVSATVSFDAPGVVEVYTFSLTLDTNGVIADAKTEDAKTGEVSSHNEAFTKELLKVIKGKKLSELKNVDKIGTSSLTTSAFNSAIPTLQSF